MTSSGTYTFDPAFSTVVQSAYARIGIRRTALTAEHLVDAGNEGNFLLSAMASEQPLLWKQEYVSVPLIQGTATYTLDKNLVMVLLGRVQTGSGSTLTNRVLGPLSMTDYAALPNPESQAPPSSFWFNRKITPEISLYPTPDGNGPYTLSLLAVTQVQDAALPSGATLDLPYRALDAFLAGLAHRLARIHAPQLEQVRKADADEAWSRFEGSDVENVNFSVVPMLGGYFR